MIQVKCSCDNSSRSVHEKINELEASEHWKWAFCNIASATNFDIFLRYKPIWPCWTFGSLEKPLYATLGLLACYDWHHRPARLQQSYLHVSICCLSKLWGQSAPGPSQHHQLQRRSLRNLLIVARSRQEKGGQSVRCWRVEGLRATEEEHLVCTWTLSSRPAHRPSQDGGDTTNTFNWFNWCEHHQLITSHK